EFFLSSRRRHTIFSRDWSSDVCSSDLAVPNKKREAKASRCVTLAAVTKREALASRFLLGSAALTRLWPPAFFARLAVLISGSIGRSVYAHGAASGWSFRRAATRPCAPGPYLAPDNIRHSRRPGDGWRTPAYRDVFTASL